MVSLFGRNLRNKKEYLFTNKNTIFMQEIPSKKETKQMLSLANNRCKWATRHNIHKPNIL